MWCSTWRQRKRWNEIHFELCSFAFCWWVESFLNRHLMTLNWQMNERKAKNSQSRGFLDEVRRNGIFGASIYITQTQSSNSGSDWCQGRRAMFTLVSEVDHLIGRQSHRTELSAGHLFETLCTLMGKKENVDVKESQRAKAEEDEGNCKRMRERISSIKHSFCSISMNLFISNQTSHNVLSNFFLIILFRVLDSVKANPNGPYQPNWAAQSNLSLVSANYCTLWQSVTMRCLKGSRWSMLPLCIFSLLFRWK